jgi:hypothetical protein
MKVLIEKSDFDTDNPLMSAVQKHFSHKVIQYKNIIYVLCETGYILYDVTKIDDNNYELKVRG